MPSIHMNPSPLRSSTRGAIGISTLFELFIALAAQVFILCAVPAHTEVQQHSGPSPAADSPRSANQCRNEGRDGRHIPASGLVTLRNDEKCLSRMIRCTCLEAYNEETFLESVAFWRNAMQIVPCG